MKKMFFNDKKRRKAEPLELDITSLLDVLVILLVFLLKSYNASDLKLDLVKNLVVPSSDTRTLGRHAVIIQIDSYKKIFVNKIEIGTISNSGENPDLLKQLNSLKLLDREPAESKKPKTINLVFDQTLPYKYIKGVMHTAAMAGHTEFKFIVQGNY